MVDNARMLSGADMEWVPVPEEVSTEEFLEGVNPEDVAIEVLGIDSDGTDG